MTIVPEPRVNRERLLELLSVKTETPRLDFKEKIDLSRKADQVELAKDVAAMQVDGGYIVIGADSAGNPTPRFDAALADPFDEARLRSILQRWLPEPHSLMIATHQYADTYFALIYVAPNPNGVVILKADGQYEHKGRTKTVFRQGDVFVREGTASRRWSQTDYPRIMAAVRDRQKDIWLREFRGDLLDLIKAGTDASALAHGPASAVTWKLDRKTLADVLVELLRQNDEVAIELFFEGVVADAGPLIASEDLSELKLLLDQLTCAAALFARVGKPRLFARSVDALEAIYTDTIGPHGADRPGTTSLWIAQARIQIVTRVAAIGALTVRKQNWAAVTELVLRHPPHQDIRSGFYTNWFRQAFTNAARQGLLEYSDGKSAGGGFLSMVKAHIEHLACLRPEFRSAEDDTSERLLDSVVQFDVLAHLAVLGRAPGDRDYPYYPSFASFNWSRFETLLAELVTNADVKLAVHGGSDEVLAADIVTMLQQAKREGFQYGGGGPLSDERITAFLDRFGQRDE